MTSSRNDSHPIPTWVVSPESWASFSANLSPVALSWATQHGFNGGAGQAVIVPNEHGEVSLALLGAGDEKAKIRQRFIVGAAAAKLPKGTVEDLLKPENKKKLTDLLTYHVLKGKVMAADVKTMMAETANGAKLDIKVTDGAVTVNGAKVVKADVTASNGVIHVIDTVLMPPAEKDKE